MSTRLADQLREYVDALQKQVTHLKNAADQAREETSAQVRARIEQAKADVAADQEPARDKAGQAAGRAQSQWQSMKADAAARMRDWGHYPVTARRWPPAPATRTSTRGLRQSGMTEVLRDIRRRYGLALGFWPECLRRLRVKRDFACTFTRHVAPVLVVLRTRSCLRLEGRTRTLTGPSPDLSPARTTAGSSSRPRWRPVPPPCLA
jgi:hypothetical protein